MTTRGTSKLSPGGEEGRLGVEDGKGGRRAGAGEGSPLEAARAERTEEGAPLEVKIDRLPNGPGSGRS